MRPGDILAGKYRVERVLGIGGMGIVVAAHHIALDQRVALKFLLPAAIQNAEAVERFGREARAAVRIQSEHVARVSDVGQLENGAPFMVMEYLEGGDLAAWVRDRGPLPVEQAVEFLLQACEAIADAHAIGIVHRDLKPANLFCIRRTDGSLSIKVLDFGISKLTSLSASGASMGMTKTSSVMGSPLYMSPEQMQSPKTVDGRTDIWSLGVVLFELVAGRPPFQGETFPELVLSIATQPAPSLRAVQPGAPEELARVVARSLEKDRSRRFQNVAELAVALTPFAPKSARHSVDRISRVLQGAGVSTSSPMLPTSGTDGAPAVGTVGAWGQTAPPAGKKTRAMLLGAGAALALVAVAGAFAVKLQSPPGRAAGQVPGPDVPGVASAPVEAPMLAPTPPPVPSVAADPAPSAARPPSSPPVPAPASSSRKAEGSGGAVARPDKAAPAGASSAGAHPALAAPANPNCDPPYYYNARHDRVFKAECL